MKKKITIKLEIDQSISNDKIEEMIRGMLSKPTVRWIYGEIDPEIIKISISEAKS